MPVHERRQHFRIDDQIYFDYKILQPGGFFSDKSITDELLGQNGQRYVETTQYFQSLDYELSELTQEIALKDPTMAHYLNLINAKIDHLAHHLLIGEKIHLRKVNISLGGMAFKAKDRIKEKTRLKIVIYTKPKMVPIILDATVVYSQFLGESMYRTAVQFETLTNEQEQLLSQHIMLAQVRCRAD
ncbi:PilZ domain-containing protein [Legionella taurinensis]|uniref:Type IV pilus assembly PilZ n=3 Tax=Legionella TaxID=445 RepID=A0A0W0XY67_9GAMM|nr:MULTISPECIES: PilZ domain-containing protein [Legionella]KTC99368.1 type IV pilus assembly PilZ [Legionella erythra]KTD49577.1 type IV pilus assembly PilZ [Legionella rubrilucens]MDX1838062.1 PilZ domain-containing protein [Legionella taurinensis]PUT39355.1 PilZ domain-containing protein [Legionella taurinensis]PUT41664.1 PilZ domain-containing protein [Legionella taurinensis]